MAGNKRVLRVGKAEHGTKRKRFAEEIITIFHLVRKLAIIVSIDPMAVRLKNATQAAWPDSPPPKHS